MIKFIFRYIIFWILFFFVNRLIFISFFIDEVSQSSFLHFLQLFPQSFRLDMSFIAYLLFFLALVIFIFSFIKSVHAFLRNIFFIFTTFFLLLSGVINGSEVALYSEWKTKLNYTALSHFVNPSEVFSTASLYHITILSIFFVISLGFIFLYKRKIHNYLPLVYIKNSLRNIFFRIMALPLVLGLLLIVIRGGIQPIPINLSDAYFSNNLILNDIAVNPNWNIFQSILKSKTNITGNPYMKYNEKECLSFISDLYSIEKDTTISVLNTKDPNLIFIILESWSADNIESLGGLEGITPNFKKLEEDGLLFTDFYSNGWTSDQGISSIFSSFPVFPYVAIINQSDKSRRLPSLNKSLDNYVSSFFFGGQLTYGNIKGYLFANNFDILKDENDYSHLPDGRLGVHDEYMFEEFRNEISIFSQPFLSTLFTISSHSPYDFPGEHTLSFNSKEDAYVNSVAYTDKCLGDFIRSVKDEEWYSNTLFVVLADHSHNSPRGWRIAQKERFKIPMLWFGEALKEEYRGQTHDKRGSHIDITPTLLSQMDIDDSAYYWGRDLFNPYEKSVVPYAFHKGYGLITDESYYAFSEIYQRTLATHAIDSTEDVLIKKEAEMFFQSAFQDYIDL